MNIKAQFETDYNTNQLIKLYDICFFRDQDKFDKEFPELIECRENLFEIIYFSKILRSTPVANSRLAHEALMYIELTNNKKFNYTDEIRIVLGKRDNDFLQSLINYVALTYPLDLINKDVEEYVLAFGKIESILYRNVCMGSINKKDVKNNRRLHKLVELFENIRKKYHDVFVGVISGAYLMPLVISYCYYRDTDYDLVYNCLEDPLKYIDTLVLRGHITFYEPHYYIWNTDGKKNAFQEMETICGKQNIIIK